jgi:predicted small integral membrane protein
LVNDVPPRSTRRPPLSGLGTLPVAATVMTSVLALYMLLVLFGNITDFGTNREFVQHVLAMDSTFHDPHVMWRAITNPALQDAAYVCVIIWEGLTTAVLVYAVVLWGLAFRRSSTLERARQVATLGLLMIVALFAGGFIAVGGEWFAMWQSTEWNGLQPALQNTILAAFALVLVQLPSRHWEAAGSDPA